MSAPTRCPLCDGAGLEVAFRYCEPPPGETRFDVLAGDYAREWLRCPTCGHLTAFHELELGELYAGGYVDATYPGDAVAATYERVMSLPPDQSDNVQRVRRIVEWWDDASPPAPRTVLDVGSGLAVFPARMKERGWCCTALDPDPRAAWHARDRVGVEAVHADFMRADDLGRFGLVTFNKVLEHVGNPVAMLARSARFLEPGGVVYVEVPDGEMAATDAKGSQRQEFFIEHLNVFSMSSLSLLADRAGFDVLRAERLHEPSGKYTLYAFLRPDSSGPRD
jgi:SAM-dependent methyltransferase